jgi:hypothetical protein
MNCLKGRRGRNAEAGCRSKISCGRQFHGLQFRQYDILGGSAHWALPLTVPDPDPFPYSVGIHAFTNHINDASAVTVWHDTLTG